MSGKYDEQAINSMDDLMKAANAEFVPEVQPKEEPAKEEAVIEANTDEVVDEEEKKKEAYIPNLTYKVKDKELKFDDRFASIIKTKEDEDYVRELHTKAGGLDSYKEKLAEEAKQREELLKQIEEHSNKIKQSERFYSDILTDREQKNVRSIAKRLGLSEQDLLAAALEIAAEQEMPESSREVARANRENAEKVRELERYKQENETVLSKYLENLQATEANRIHAELVEKQTREMNDKISTKYADLSKALKDNDIDLFQEAVVVGRSLYEQRGGKDVSVDEALEAAAKKYSKLVSVAKDDKKLPERKDALPTIGGGSASPVGDKTPSSLEDIMKELDKIQNKKL